MSFLGQCASRFKSGVEGEGKKICFHTRTNKSPRVDVFGLTGSIWIILNCVHKAWSGVKV